MIEENILDLYPRWFVYSVYTYSGAPKLEDALMNWARNEYMYNIIPEMRFDDVLEELQKKQDELWAQNKRWKKVEIRFSKSEWDANNKWLFIGSQNLRLMRVKGIID